AIISKQSGVSEVVDHCLKVDFWDVDEMANKIIGVLNHRELAQTLSENAFADIKRINWDESARKCCEVYDRLVGG
ncbi:glycosyltransferase family 1 protein, partial [Candidatus Woesearchaeota archaeon]|nr:glycosyltransferase family 1 protein [Candidatus Woesearchaeota archaeon]